MSEIAEYIASENYESLVHTVLGTEYTTKDRTDILKYIRRKNAFSRIATETLYKLRVSCGDLSDVTRYYEKSCDDTSRSLMTVEAQNQYRNLIAFCPASMIFDKAKDFFIKDIVFVKELCSIPFNSGLHPGIADFDLIQKIFCEINHVDDPFIKYNLLEYFVLCMIYNFSDHASKFHQIMQSNSDLEATYIGICYRIFDNRRHYIAQELKIAKDILQSYQGADVFSDEMKEIVYNKACHKPNDPDSIEIVKLILNSGFKKITAGFNHAVSIWNEELVKVILPYRPKLDKALTQTTSPAIKYLLTQAAEQRAKKKKVN